MPIDFSDLIPAGGAPQSAPSPISFDDLIPQQVSTAGDLARAVPSGLAQGVAAAVGAPAWAKGWVDAGVRNAPALWGGHVISPEEAAAQDARRGPDLIPDAGDASRYAQQAIEAIPGVDYKPQTTAGRYAQTAAEFVPGALAGPGGVVGNAIKFGVLPGVASEAAGDLTRGTPVEPYARVLAPILAGGGAALASRPGTAAAAVRDAAGNLDQSTLGAAQSLMDDAARQGSPISLAEAVQQVTNSGTRLGSLQRVVEQSRGGAEPMARFYADRPGQVQQAGNAAIDRVGPVPDAPSAVAPAIQQAAESTIGDAYKARTAAVNPLYQRAATDQVSPEAVQSIIDDLGQQIASDKTGLLAGPLGDLRKRLIDQSAKPASVGLEPDPIAGPASGQPRPFAPTEDYAPRAAPVRPDVPRPQTLQDLVRSLGGVQDPRGDLKSMGLDLIPGLVAKPGKGLGPDAVRQVAAEQGYLGANIDEAMANTTPNDLFNALGEHPVHSVKDAEGVHQWSAFDQARAEADQVGKAQTRSARPENAPPSAYARDIDPAAPLPAKPVPITDIENLDRTRKYFRDKIDLPQFAPDAIDKETGARIGSTLGQLDTAMEGASPAYGQAKQRYQGITRDTVAPLENGMIGALAKSKEFGAQTRIILGENPLPGSEGEVANAVAAVKAKAPGAAQALVSQKIRQSFNEATQSNMGGPNQWGAAKFAAMIQGNTQQARNLQAAVEALHGPGVWRDFQKTLDVFEAMGRRQAPGSMTEFNRQIASDLSKGGKIGETVATAASPAKMLGKAQEIYQGWKYGRNTEALADLLTRPDAARVFASIAGKSPGSSAAQGQAALYLLGAAAHQQGKPGR